MADPDRSMMPALFIGHGSPINAVADNDVTRAWRAIARRIPRPRAIVCISAHRETKGVLIKAPQGTCQPKSVGSCRIDSNQ
jgi:4,5-DOPA dioxygenase extradiol